VKQPIETWKGLLENDFEKTVFKHHPQIKEIKEKMYEMGAQYTSMTGSGSTVYGIFDKAIKEKPFQQNNYETIEITAGKSYIK